MGMGLGREDDVSEMERRSSIADRRISVSSSTPAASTTDGEGQEGTVVDSDDDGEEQERNIERLLEADDKVFMSYNCARVAGMDKRDGVFLICALNLYFVADYQVASNGKIVEAASPLKGCLSSTGSTGSWGGGGGQGGDRNAGATRQRQLWKWSYADIREVHKRRYLLRPVAIELFITDGRNALLVFDIDKRDEVFNRILERDLPNSVLNNMQALSFSSPGDMYESGSEVASGGGVVGAKLGVWKRTVTQRWQQGNISNFHYLMHLNTLAGRGYNDLTQYPVFPWVLRDYESEELDLSNSASYRDFSKPMGGQTEGRAIKFQERFAAWEDGEVPKFHYGTHYSSPAIVLYFLIRLQPFARLALQLQGGHFDHPGRIFHSIADAWRSASEDNMADVKELTPEFFYLPEMLLNLNKFDFGRRSDGVPIDDVILPTWAHGDPHEFVRKHREALESDYVSANLHKWIDLVFGYQQQGAAADAAQNVFYHLTYEGAVDIDAISDPVKRDSTVAQINHFGQTPLKLFDKPHPQRIPPSAAASASRLLLHFSPSSMTPTHIRQTSGAVRQLWQTMDSAKVAAIGGNRVLLPPRYDSYVSWGHADQSIRIYTVEGDEMCAIVDSPHDATITIATVSSDGGTLVTGAADGVVSIWSMEKGSWRERPRLQFRQSLCAHTAAITCLAVSKAYSAVVSGSADTTCIVWDLNRLRYVQQLPLFGPATAVIVNDVTGQIITADGPNIRVWGVNGGLVAMSVSHDMPDDGDVALCLGVSRGSEEWVQQSAIFSGHRDGTVRAWSIGYSDDPIPIPIPAPAPAPLPVSVSSSSPSAGPGTTLVGMVGKEKICHELVLRSSICGHQAPVTAIWASDDQRRLWSGDSGGHIYVWSIPPITLESTFPSSLQTTSSCSACGSKFTLIANRQQQCRMCGKLFCSNCTKRTEIPSSAYKSGEVRVCEQCATSVQG
mmetsp:Transcript_12674/g.20670  ORF Transcript_12674/g.20670 Transcript_12674/m.20670 type:complete len:954 (+) Transcript_12674:301-3162(+)